MLSKLYSGSLFTRSGALRILAVLTVFALLVSACGPTPEPTSPPPTEAPTKAAPAPTVAPTEAPTTAPAEPTATPAPVVECDDVLNTAFHIDMQVPDPDIFYEVEGHGVMLRAYESLLQYDPSAPDLAEADIIPLLAESYEVSDDGLVWTFNLRDDITFASGRPVTSEDVKFSFERRTAVDQGPAWFLHDVDHYETPDPQTFIVHLTQRISAFAHYMASPYGPKVVDPEIIKANEVDGDWGQEYLQTHSAGTGPFQIAEFELGNYYRLVRNENYWGGTPNFKEIRIDVIPEKVTQQLRLEEGELDIIHWLPPETFKAFQGREGFQTLLVSSLQNQVIKVNPNKPPFDDIEVRKALRSAIDREKIVPEVWGDIATPSQTMLPKGMLPEGYGADVWEYDPEPLKKFGAELPDEAKKVTIVHQIDAVGDERMAEAVQTVLLEAGFDAVVQPVPISALFEYRDADPDVVPNLVVELEFPDAAHPETYAGIFYRVDGFLNFVRGGSEEADELMNQALLQTDLAEEMRLYGEAMDALHETATFISTADVSGDFVAKEELTGWIRTASPRILDVSKATLCYEK